MSKLFFTSDSHFGHGNILKYCARDRFLTDADRAALEANGGSWHDGTWKGSRSSSWKISPEAVEAMNDHLFDNINKMVGVDDELWHLGDFAFVYSKSRNKQDKERDYYNKCREYRDRIKCRNVYLVWGNHDERNIKDLFTRTYDQFCIYAGGQDIVVNHYAMAVWDSSHRGAWQLYGHSHSGAEPWMDQHMPGRRSFDVGVDNANKLLGDYRPFSYAEVEKIMSTRKGFSMDHHVPANVTGPREEDCSGIREI